MVGSLRSFLVVVALSFHSVFEGLAIGIQQTQRDVWYLFTAVSIHACAILFCIGLELVTSGVRVINIVLYIVILALVSPLGVAIGILVTIKSSTEGPTQDLVVAVLQGIAGGTILYITFFEVLDRERRKQNGCGIMRLAFILVGFSVMVALQALGE
jgi:zinc transporter 1/2/3